MNNWKLSKLNVSAWSWKKKKKKKKKGIQHYSHIMPFLLTNFEDFFLFYKLMPSAAIKLHVELHLKNLYYN